MPLFKIYTVTAGFLCVGKCSCDSLRSKIYLRSDATIVEHPLILQPDTPSSRADLDGLRRFVAFKMSNSEMRGNCSIVTGQQTGVTTHRSITNRLRAFCKNLRYLDKLNYISTIYIEVSDIGIVFRKRGHIYPEIGSLGFQVLVCVLMPCEVCQTELQV